MPVRCSRCVSKNLECRVLPDSDQCGECARSTGRASCDVYGNSHDLRTIEELEAFKEKERLERERAEAEQAGQARASSSSEVDPSIFELPPMSDSELAAWLEAEGSFGGTSPNLVGSSGS
ncbi:hypothetical protein CJF32_00003116 [Rutstroemia sp. NJR-2017a WRK4]|nr:hypothetical protein CJF32_00003116 [Rutstroemia sp. NJR-2017a WRK4]